MYVLFPLQFQKYALESLQQLLADHPPAPVGQDPDEGTAQRVNFAPQSIVLYLYSCHDKIVDAIPPWAIFFKLGNENCFVL